MKQEVIKGNIGFFWHAGLVPQYLERYKPFLKYYKKVYVFVPKGWFEYNEEEINIEGVIIVRLDSVFNFHQHTFMFKGIEKSLRNIKLKTVYIHEEPNSLVTFQLARLLKRSNTEFYIDSAVINFKGRIFGYNPFENYIYKHTKGFFYRNNLVKDFLIKRGCPKHKLLGQMGNGVSEKVFYPIDDFDNEKTRKIYNLSNDSFLLGYSGRINKYKGCDLLLNLLELDDSLEVLICGVVEDYELFAKLISHNRITYLGYLSPKELNIFYNLLDVLILPSRGNEKWIEQFGRVLIESISASTPAIGSNIGMIGEIVGKENIFNPNSISEVYSKVKKLKNKKEILKTLEFQQNIVQENYTWQALAAHFIKLTNK